jgi:hypothetical protein
MDYEDDYVMLRFDFEKEANCRRRTAEEHPGDTRQVEAAVILERLVETTSQVPHDLLREYHDLLRGETELALHSKRLRQIGFEYFPITAEEFVRDGVFVLKGSRSGHRG